MFHDISLNSSLIRYIVCEAGEPCTIGLKFIFLSVNERVKKSIPILSVYARVKVTVLSCLSSIGLKVTVLCVYSKDKIHYNAFEPNV